MTLRTCSASLRYNDAICCGDISVAEGQQDHRPDPRAPVCGVQRSGCVPLRRLSAVSGPTFPREPLGLWIDSTLAKGLERRSVEVPELQVRPAARHGAVGVARDDFVDELEVAQDAQAGR